MIRYHEFHTNAFVFKVLMGNGRVMIRKQKIPGTIDYEKSAP